MQRERDELPQVQHLVPLVERQQALIEELRRHAPRIVPGAALVRRLGASPRTLERDIARLVAAGMPIASRPGPGGGYAFNGTAREIRLVLTPTEAGALIASLAAVGPFSSPAAQSALQKLVSGLTG